ncbi:DUF4340 domain-containing protein [Kiritimatiellaeota bacterium B1221]|nr:DUF4340 domain-containing protein [Kiritimatiellaeota bacterium B1221]
MKKIFFLGGLLVVQLMVVFLTLAGGDKLQQHSGIQKLLEFNPKQIDEIRIKDGEDALVQLIRKDGHWTTEGGFPADEKRVEQLFDRLEELSHGMAVAQSDEAATRFEVSPDNFQRHLEIRREGKTVAGLYVGSGAGVRRSHVRIADQDPIYALTIGGYDLPATVADWQDKTLLQMEEADVRSVKVDGLTILRKPKQVPGQEEEADQGNVVTDAEGPLWAAEGLSEEETFREERFESLLRDLATLRYNRAAKGEAEDVESIAEATVSMKNSERDYRIFQAGEGNGFRLKVSDHDEVFELSSYAGQNLVDKLTRTHLVTRPEMEDDSEEQDKNDETVEEDPSDSTTTE